MLGRLCCFNFYGLYHQIENLLTHFVGGTFALYSLICRHAKVSLLPNRQVADEALSTYKMEHPPEKNNKSKVKLYLEKRKGLHTALLILVLLGTCMVIGDGLLTPAISGESLSSNTPPRLVYAEFLSVLN